MEASLTFRSCKKCHESVPLTSTFFYKWGKNRSGRFYWHCKRCHRKDCSRWDRENRDLRKGYKLKRLYGLSLAAYHDLLEAQGGVCAICKEPPDAQEWMAVDHDWKCCAKPRTCGACVRGLLHRRCNLILGNAGDNPATLRRAAEYLETRS